jgi:putative FmdB family regulatory protein
MPLYEYECKKCHHRFERIRKFSDPKIRTCPNCGGPVEQLISASAMQFKGSGWYVNDYPKKSGGGSSSSPSDNESSAGESSTKDTDSKKEEKPKAEKSEKKKAEKK